MNHVTEIVMFRLQDGVDEAEFLAKAQATFDLLATFDGYISRELSVGEDGQWVDVVIWRSLEAAQKAGEAFMKSDVGQAFEPYLAPESIQLRHTEPKISTLAAKHVLSKEAL